ncbi:MAG: Cupredoxin family domain protein [Candidatus Curtissbacteria bacterium GW2011_GWA1_40_16]|uniref:Cupredoxin family domain protein n=1 Tax=Candidatus Curtissbacteria bacterium GW2011_GWA1_40_16 TaxID=1618405 RepID=A0A0G0UMB6_9BACT|nr:MAG: Cupredoxin family domain protein [Candidatus Curtissbacteria bacterium GW2011_GWA1_40_16]
MTPDKIFIILLSLIGIGFTYWFFLMKKDNAVIVKDSVDIKVDGGYSPSVISVPKNKKITLSFLRSDPNNCLEEVLLPEFKIRKFLPLNKKVDITITPKRAGEYEIVCGMNMFHGKILVR